MGLDIQKIYDIIKEEQRNADTKANIFIVLLSAVVAFISNVPTDLVTTEDLSVLQYIFLFLVIPIILLVWSLIPIYTNKYSFNKKKKYEDLNIYYWKTIEQYKDSKTFVENFCIKYDLKEVSVIENQLLEQIYVNANILENKVYLHKLSFYILGHILLFIFLGFIGEFIIGYNYYLGTLFIILEIYYTNRIFKVYSKIIKPRIIKLYRWIKRKK